MAVIPDDTAGKAICEALGLDHTKVYSIDINLKALNVGLVTVGMYLTHEDTKAIVSVLKEYKLVPKE